MATLKIEKSLPQNKLAYYNDSFDKLREDLWDKSIPAFKRRHLANFKLADMNFEDGQLKVVTKAGYFSTGGFVSRYALRGDFDIQVDCSRRKSPDKSLGTDQLEHPQNPLDFFIFHGIKCYNISEFSLTRFCSQARRKKD